MKLCEGCVSLVGLTWRPAPGGQIWDQSWTLWTGFCWPEPVQVSSLTHTPLLCFMSVGNFLPWHPHVITKKWRCVTNWKVLSFSSEMKAPHPEVWAPTLAQKRWLVFPSFWPLTQTWEQHSTFLASFRAVAEPAAETRAWHDPVTFSPWSHTTDTESLHYVWTCKDFLFADILE